MEEFLIEVDQESLTWGEYGIHRSPYQDWHCDNSVIFMTSVSRTQNCSYYFSASKKKDRGMRDAREGTSKFDFSKALFLCTQASLSLSQFFGSFTVVLCSYTALFGRRR